MSRINKDQIFPVRDGATGITYASYDDLIAAKKN